MTIHQPKPAEWLQRKEAAAYLESIGCPISPKTLLNLAANNNEGGGPPFRRIRKRRVFYSRAELSEWASKNTQRVG